MKCVRFYFGEESIANAYWVALRLIECVGPWEEAWLWLNKPDTWKRQGLHLFNRLRQSYGEIGLIEESPVQQFYGYEEADLCSFVVAAVMNEWSFYLFTSHDYGRLFVSQSSGAEVWVSNDVDMQPLATALESHGISLAIDSNSFQTKA